MCVIVCCEMDTLTPVGTHWYLHMEMGIMHAFILGKRYPRKSICSDSPLHYGSAHCVVIWQSEQTTSHKRGCAWNASGSGGRGLNGNDLLWRKPKLFVSPYSREEKEVHLLVCLIVFWDNLTVGWLFAGLSSSRCVKEVHQRLWRSWPS